MRFKHYRFVGSRSFFFPNTCHINGQIKPWVMHLGRLSAIGTVMFCGAMPLANASPASAYPLSAYPPSIRTAIAPTPLTHLAQHSSDVEAEAETFADPTSERQSEIQPEDRQAVLEVLDQMRVAAIALPNSATKPQPLVTLADTYQYWGDASHRHTIIGLLVEAEESIPLAQSPDEKATLHQAIAHQYLLHGESQRAIVHLQPAIATAQEIQDDEQRLRMLQAIAADVKQLTDMQQAVPLLNGLVAASDRLSTISDKANLLSNLTSLVADWPNIGGEAEAIAVLDTMIAKADMLLATETNVFTSQQLPPSRAWNQNWSVSSLLYTIAQTIGDLGNPSQGVRLLEKTKAISDRVADEKGERTLLAIAEAYGKVGQPQRSLEMINSAVEKAFAKPLDPETVENLGQSVIMALELGDRQLGLDIVSRSIDQFEQRLEDSQINEAGINGTPSTVRLADMEWLLKQLDDYPTPFLHRLLELSPRLSSSWDQVVLIRILAFIVDDPNQTPHTLTFVESMMREVESWTQEELKRSALVHIAEQTHQWENGAANQTILQQVVQSISGMQTFRVRVMEVVGAAAVNLGQQGDGDGARVVLSSMADVLEQADRSTQSWGWRTLATSYGTLGDERQQVEFLWRGLQGSMLLTDHRERVGAIRDIAKQMVTLEDVDQAEALLMEAIALISAVEPTQRNMVLGVLDSLGQWDASDAAMIRVVEATEPIADSLSLPMAQVRAWVTIAAIYAQLEDSNPNLGPRSDERLDQAIPLLLTTQDESQVTMVLETIAELYPALFNDDHQAAILADAGVPDAITADSWVWSLNIMRQAMSMGATEHAVEIAQWAIANIELMTHVIIQASPDEFPTSHVERKYGVSDPDEQAQIVLNEVQSLVMIATLRELAERSSYMADPTDLGLLEPVLDSAITVTRKMPHPYSRFYALIGLSEFAVDTNHKEHLLLTLTEAVHTLDQVPTEFDIFISILIEDTFPKDGQIVTQVLSQIIMSMDQLSADDKEYTLEAIAKELSDLGQLMHTHEDEH